MSRADMFNIMSRRLFRLFLHPGYNRSAVLKGYLRNEMRWRKGVETCWTIHLKPASDSSWFHVVLRCSKLAGPDWFIIFVELVKAGLRSS